MSCSESAPQLRALRDIPPASKGSVGVAVGIFGRTALLAFSGAGRPSLSSYAEGHKYRELV